MNRRLPVLVLIVLAQVLLTGCRKSASYGVQDRTQCIIRTALGDIGIEVFEEAAPATSANFLAYVDASLYDSTSFFRVCTPENESGREIRIEVIQGGDVPDSLCFDPIPIETTQMTGLSHTDGAVSMARGAPESATSSYFICIGDQPELDHGGRRNPDGFGFAVFGRVIRGMDVVKRIQELPDSAQMLIEPVIVFSIDRIEKQAASL